MNSLSFLQICRFLLPQGFFCWLSPTFDLEKQGPKKEKKMCIILKRTFGWDQRATKGPSIRIGSSSALIILTLFVLVWPEKRKSDNIRQSSENKNKIKKRKWTAKSNELLYENRTRDKERANQDCDKISAIDGGKRSA